MNKVILIGNVGKDPENRVTHSGAPVVNFSLATSRFRKEDGPDWHNVAAFGKTAEIIQKYVKKGSRIAVEGRIEYQKSQDRVYTNIIASSVELLGGKAEGAERAVDEFEASDEMPF
ncbi:MAG: single-stranded DNA-binding protein [Alphaproteobacteria bacterium]